MLLDKYPMLIDLYCIIYWWKPLDWEGHDK